MKRRLDTRHESEFDFPAEVLVAQISHKASEKGYEFDSEQLVAEPSGRIMHVLGFEHRFELESLPDKNRCKLTEDIYKSVYFEIPALAASLMLIFSAYTYTIAGILFIALVGLGGVLLWSYFQLKEYSFTTDISSIATHKSEKHYSVGSVLSPVILATSGIVFGLGYRTVVSDGVAVVLIGSIFYYILSFNNGGLIYRTTFRINIRKVVPRLPLLYIVTAASIPALTVMCYLLQNQTLPFEEGDASIATEIFLALYELPFLVLAVLVGAFIYGVSKQALDQLYYDFVDRPGQLSNKRNRALLGLLLVGMSYFMLVAVVWLVLNFTELWGNSYILGAGATVVLATSSYFLMGVVYEVGTFVMQLRRFLDDSSSLDIDLAGDDVRVVESENSEGSGAWASSVSTWFVDYIFISREAVEKLEESELRAVLEHERAHVDNGEASLSFNLVVISLLTFVGRNVFFSLIDFNAREQRADRRAAEEVGVDPLIGALEKLSGNPKSSHLIGSSPFSGDFPVNKSVYKYFDLFFGDYALREAHPDTDDRIRVLEEKDHFLSRKLMSR